jgi:hypothetical protein
MTPTAVGLVLVEGHEADGEIMDQDAFDVPTRRGAAAISMSDYVAGALSRTRAIADGRQPHTIGVTWSDDFELEASVLLKSLSDEGFNNVVAVRSPEASEALARGIGRAVGYEQTAVCLVEPDSVVVSVVDTHGGMVQTITQHDQYTVSGLIGWLTDVFDANDWHPQCLIIVGPDAGVDALTTRLERALGLAVFAPAEVEFALARGAALASAGRTPDYGGPAADGHRAPRHRPRPYTAALAMLIAGVVTFVVSTSLAVGLELTSDKQSATTPSERPASPPPKPAVVAEPVPPPAASPLPVQAAPPPEAPPPARGQPPANVQVDQHEQLVDVVPDAAPSENAAPPPDTAPSPEAQPPPEAAPPPTDVPPPVPTVAGSKPPLLTRILTHVPGLHGEPEPPPAAAVPPESPAAPPP